MYAEWCATHILTLCLSAFLQKWREMLSPSFTGMGLMSGKKTGNQLNIPSECVCGWMPGGRAAGGEVCMFMCGRRIAGVYVALTYARVYPHTRMEVRPGGVVGIERMHAKKNEEDAVLPSSACMQREREPHTQRENDKQTARDREG